MKIPVLFLLVLLNLIGIHQSWTRLGTTTVKFTAQQDAVYPVANYKFERIKFAVSGAPISLEDANVVFTDGSSELIHILAVVYKGSESRELVLKNDTTDITRINFTYKAAKGFGDQNAKISVWGKPKSF
ncbi:MAG: hypothetical protein C5B52_14150 [Bacteroidetes bacterium]|nr:MAG: hypothetical protein C5B52_14150 [Bacteroidota bacterium]